MKASQVGIVAVLCICFVPCAIPVLPARALRKDSCKGETWLLPKDPASIPPPPSADAEKKTVAVTGGDLFYLDSGGDGPILLLLHANTGSSFSWGHQFKAFTAAGYRVIAPTLRGGRATTATLSADSFDRTIQNTFDDINALINASSAESVHVLGTASGGFYGLTYANKHPDRVDSLTLAATALGINDSTFQGMLVRILTPTIRALPVVEKEFSPSFRAANPAAVQAWVDLLVEAPHSYKGKRAPFGFDSGPGKEELAAWSIPTFFLYGGADLTSPVLARYAQSIMAGSPCLTILAEVGHNPEWEQPDHFNDAVLNFLSSV